MTRPSHVITVLHEHTSSGLSLVRISGHTFAIRERDAAGRETIWPGRYRNLGVALARYRRATGDASITLQQ